MWALRAQTDKVEYAQVMRRVLEATPNLSLREVRVLKLCEEHCVSSTSGLTASCAQ